MDNIVTIRNGMTRSVAYIDAKQIRVNADSRINPDTMNTLAEYIISLEERIAKLERQLCHHIILKEDLDEHSVGDSK